MAPILTTDEYHNYLPFVVLIVDNNELMKFQGEEFSFISFVNVVSSLLVWYVFHDHIIGKMK